MRRRGSEGMNSVRESGMKIMTLWQRVKRVVCVMDFIIMTCRIVMVSLCRMNRFVRLVPKFVRLYLRFGNTFIYSERSHDGFPFQGSRWEIGGMCACRCPFLCWGLGCAGLRLHSLEREHSIIVAFWEHVSYVGSQAVKYSCYVGARPERESET